MSATDNTNWYLVKTKPYKERWVCDQLSGALDEVYLPLLRARRRQWGKPVTAISALFPCYLFARFDLRSAYFQVKYTPGVHGLVAAGREPLAVPPSIIEQLRQRGTDGIIELPPKAFAPGARVRVMEGPFRGFDAIFERYLSSAQRVAILLEAVASQGVRVVLPAGYIAECN